ncbi:replication-relaxation family protein [Nocardia mexicana]|uniref:Protein involved in plasmid replication-relaxation n=1 Tax=Nocardia mexicana TaxID=279262 RepID=A0A370HB48_9NOCA|nr:replication-relaxation family protein [Nocardia mexicana]RDI54020.1 protein involved in plasmid replication-relaxation [Nocardia mexicana]
MLQSVWMHRVLTARQIQRLHFGELSPVSGLAIGQRALRKLRALRVLGVAHYRRGRHRGRPELVYYVDAVGDRLLRADSGRKQRYQWHEPTARYLEHRLAVADVHTALVETDRRGALELVHCEVEPASWRRYLRLSSLVMLKPDLSIETTAEPGSAYVDGWFVEVDLGTESIPTLLRKCHDYQAYWRSGAEQDDDGDGFPLVVWSLAHKDPAALQRRREQLNTAIQKDPQLDPELFRIVHSDSFIHLVQKGGGL